MQLTTEQRVFVIKTYWKTRFLNQCRKRRLLTNIIVCDDAGFSLNREVRSWNVRQYAVVGEPPNFYRRPDSRQKLTVRAGWCENVEFLGPFFIGASLY